MLEVEKYKGDIVSIFVCNNSTAACIKKLEKYKSKKTMIFNIGDTKNGISKARNFGVKNIPSDVDYITFIDDDDGFYAEELNKALMDNQSYTDILVFNWTDNKYIKNNRFRSALPRKGRIDNFDKIAKDLESYLLLPKKMPYLGYCWGKLFRYELILGNKIRFNEDISTFEDVLFLLEALSKANEIYFSNNYLVNFNFIIKSSGLKASFGESFLGAMGFVTVAKYIKNNLGKCRIFKKSIEINNLLPRYTGYLFFFTLIRIVQNKSPNELFGLLKTSRKVIHDIDLEFDQAKYIYMKESGESKLVAFLNKKKFWTFAIIYKTLHTLLRTKK